VAVIQERRLEFIKPREDAHQEAPALQPLVVLILIPLGLDQDHHVGIEKDMGFYSIIFLSENIMYRISIMKRYVTNLMTKVKNSAVMAYNCEICH
jgi:hypothetical protein